MRFYQVALAALLMAAGGCASRQLKVSTADLAQTVAELQESQVLDNLVLFTEDPEAIPSFVRIIQGTVQLSDSVQGSYSISLPQHGAYYQGLGAAAYRSASFQWQALPVVDPIELRRLRAIFRAAVGTIDKETFDKELPPPPPALDEDGRPMLRWAPRSADNSAAGPSTQPYPVRLRDDKDVQWDAQFVPPYKLQYADVPKNGPTADKARPSQSLFHVGLSSPSPDAQCAGIHRGRLVWIANRREFARLVLMVLGDNSPSFETPQAPTEQPRVVPLITGPNTLIGPR